jgi:hypothetical protein
MKTTLLKKLLPLVLLLLCFDMHSQEIKTVKKKMIHYWHFNNTLPAGGAGGIHMSKIPADYSTLGHALVWYKAIGPIVLPADTGYMDNLVGDTINQRIGYGGCCTGGNSAIRTRNPSDSMQFLWYIPTQTYQNIVITYENESSSTASGMHREVYDYSLDSGQTFMTTGLPVAFDSAGTGWGKVTLDLTTLSAVNNTNKLVFRIRYTMPDISTSGNNRYDNITVEGDSIMGAAGIAEAGPISSFQCSLYPNPASDLLTIHSSESGLKTLILYDACGRLVSENQAEGNEFPFSISGLQKGFYYIKLRDSRQGNEALLKFIKL